MESQVRYPGDLVQVQHVNRTLTLPTSKIVLKNRLHRAPMSEYIAKFDPNDWKTSGIPTQTIINAYEKFAAGGFALITTGSIIVDTTGKKKFPGNMAIEPEIDSCNNNNSVERKSGFQSLSSVVHKHNAKIVGKLGAIDDFLRYLDLEDSDDESAVENAMKDVLHGANYLSECGFDGCMVAALPGAVEKAKKFVNVMVKNIRTAVDKTDFIVGLKLNTARLQQHGDYSVEDTAQLLAAIDASGYDFIEIGGGSFEFPSESAKEREDRFVHVLQMAKKAAPKTPVFIVGGLRTVKTMEQLIGDGIVDGISLARPAAAEPDIASKIICNIVSATRFLPFEHEMAVSVLAAASQVDQAGRHTLKESDNNVNEGIMDLSDPETLQKFNKAKDLYVLQEIASKAEGRPLPPIVSIQ